MQKLKETNRKYSQIKEDTRKHQKNVMRERLEMKIQETNI